MSAERPLRRARDRERGLRASPPPSPPSGPARASRSRRRARSSRATRRRRRAASRRPSATTTRPSSTRRTSGELEPRDGEHGARRGAHLRGAVRDPLARGARRRVHAGERRLPPRALRRRVREAPAPGRRPHGPRDHEGAARRRSRPAASRSSRTAPLARARSRARLARARRRARRSTPPPSILAAGGRCFAEAEERGELSTNHPGATGEVTQIALDAGAEARDLDALQYHPNGGAWPRDDAGLLHPGDDARVRRRPPERRRRGVHRLARPARRRQPGDRRRGREGQGRRDARRPPRRLPRHDAHLASTTPSSRCRTCCAATAPAGSTRSRRRSSPTPSSTTRTAGSSSTRTPRRRSRASTRAARSQAARTGATG